jgi:hypothetical protein
VTLYVSDEPHFSLRKAAGMLAIGEANVREIRTDERLRMDPADLEEKFCSCLEVTSVEEGAVHIGWKWSPQARTQG